MKTKIFAILTIAAMVFSLAACGAAESGGEETTISGMVISVEGTTVTLLETNGNMSFGGNRGEGGNFGGFNGELPEGMTMPEGGFQWDGEMPEGATMPEGGFQWNGEMPEGMTRPEGGFQGELPEGMTMPEGGFQWDGEMPEGMTRPEGGAPIVDSSLANISTITVDIANAHISVQTDGVKAGGTMEDIKAGTMVTITMKDNKVTNVLVTSQNSFGGRGGSFGGSRNSEN